MHSANKKSCQHVPDAVGGTQPVAKTGSALVEEKLIPPITSLAEPRLGFARSLHSGSISSLMQYSPWTITWIRRGRHWLTRHCENEANNIDSTSGLNCKNWPCSLRDLVFPVEAQVKRSELKWIQATGEKGEKKRKKDLDLLPALYS